MSDLSTKYHSIPPIGVLSAYKEGRLAAADQRWVEELMERNPMVAAVVEELNPGDAGVIQKVAARVHDRVVAPRLPHKGFWSRYAGWIGLSSIVLLLGIYGVFEWTQPEPRYFNETMIIAEPSVDADAEVKLSTNEMDPASSTQKSVPIDQMIRETENEDGALPSDPNTEKMPVSSVDEQKKQQLENRQKQEDAQQDDGSPTEPDKNSGGEDNTRTYSTKNSENQNVLLALNNVQILSKTNPDALNTRSKGGGGNPLGEQTTSSSSSYSVEDMPSYPGGDRALQNYFKGKLRPIEIPKDQDRFDRSVLVELTINARGKLKDYTIRGQLHPLHQKALEEAIDELPRFRKGSEKITYSLGLSF